MYAFHGLLQTHLSQPHISSVLQNSRKYCQITPVIHMFTSLAVDTDVKSLLLCSRNKITHGETSQSRSRGREMKISQLLAV